MADATGLLVAEIQQSADTTYRLFDWNRPGPDGRPRPLHIDEALEAIDYDHGPVEPRQPEPTDRPDVERLVACDKFVLDRWKLTTTGQVGGDGRCHILIVLQGTLDVEDDPAGQPLSPGGVVLLPAELGGVTIRAREPAVILDAYLP